MKTRRFLFWCSQLLLCATFYMSCEEKQQLPSVNEVRFSFESLVQQGSGEGRLKEIASPASVLVTIRNNRGQITEQKIDLYQFGGSYLSAPITLKTGEYALTKFLVIGQDQSVLAATPRTGSKYAPLVSDPLDIEFGVSLNTITTVTPEVIEVDKSSSPVDFGYGQFGFREVEMIQVVFSSFIKGASNFELTESHLKIEALHDSTDADTTAFWKYETDLEPKANVIPMKKASRYRITATKPGYKEWIKTISATNGDKVEIIFEQSSWGFKTVWNKNFGGSNMELVKKTIATKDGGVLIVGYTYSNDYDIDDLKGGSDAWALKLDAFGNIQWSKTYDMGYYDLVSSAAESGDGDGYLITGESYNENTLMGGRLLKIDNEGLVEWDKIVSGTVFYSSIAAVTGSDNFLVLSHHLNKYPTHIAMQIDDTGSMVWEKPISDEAFLFDLKIVKDGNSYILTKQKSIFYKLTAQGETEWTAKLPETRNITPSAVTAVVSDGYLAFDIENYDEIIDGKRHSRDKIRVAKFSKGGELIWKKNIEAPGRKGGFFGDITTTASGNFLLVGGSCKETNSLNSRDAWVVEISPLGEKVGEKFLFGSGSLYFYPDNNFWSVVQLNGEFVFTGNSSDKGRDIPGNYGNYDTWAMKVKF